MRKIRKVYNIKKNNNILKNFKEEEYKNKYLFRERSEIREQIMFPEF